MSNNIEQWIKFFLVGVAETSKKGKMTFEKIITLRQKCENKIITLGKKAKKGQELLKRLFSAPVISSKALTKEFQLTHPAANSLIKDFQNKEILMEITGQKRNRIFVFEEYLDLFTR